jgi:alkanesulfonate monooxygenase SsuD/methylene tetrahydromethanopterin reductase-like flavin-dependent oxidoreductase (luciferase family)
MRYGLDVPTTGEYADPRVLARLAADAERAGWHGFFVWDVLDGVDPWLALAAIALATRQITIGFMVLPLARHQPYLAAKRLAELDHLSGGRVICTVGLGFREADFVQTGVAPEPRVRAELLDEGLAIVDGLWREERFSFAGRHYRFEDASLAARPVQQPRIPLWVAGGWPYRAPFARAARWDGACFMSVNPKTREWLNLDEFRAGVAYLRTQRASGEPFNIIASGDTSGPRDEAVARVAAFGAAGATWWVEEGLGWTLDEFRDHVLQGPPA